MWNATDSMRLIDFTDQDDVVRYIHICGDQPVATPQNPYYNWVAGANSTANSISDDSVEQHCTAYRQQGAGTLQ